MRKRSSRFFVILLHLVGVSHHLPTTSRWQLFGGTQTGIVGVQPWPIVLETIHVLELPELESTEPVWLQDSTDKTCLGPTGKFTECGDATLWFVVRQKLSLPAATTAMNSKSKDAKSNDSRQRRRNKLRMGVFGIEEDYNSLGDADEEQLVYSFQVVDRDFPDPEEQTLAPVETIERPWWHCGRGRQKPQPVVECLLTTSTTAASTAAAATTPSTSEDSSRAIHVETCVLPHPDGGKNKKRRSGSSSSSASSSLMNAWAWNINEEGVFVSLASTDESTGTSTDSSSERQHQRCLWRGNGAQAVLDDCSADEQDQHRMVHFSVVRYRAVSATTSTHTGTISSSSSGSSRSQQLPQKTQSAAAPEEPEEDHLPSNKAMANRAASEHLPFRLLHDTNPILLMGHANLGGGGHRNRRDGGRKKKAVGGTSTTPSLVHPVSKDGAAEDKYIPPARMHVHPYIAASKNEVWKDPSTGLEYFTDLCHYLGRDRKEYGRHTLTGVGQYRKGYVVKVYGIAHYVSKRDVLADKIFEPYAGLSAEELRTRPEFYELLRQMPNNHQPGLGMFDRTILLKINMQLSAETMRSSLHADWKFLTDEAKNTLISSSLEPRPANEDMLKTIASPDNPSRCSCSQVAPEEYQADPSCCGRGTELGFTWLKTGHLEVSVFKLTGKALTIGSK
jgi:hypothetical protein